MWQSTEFPWSLPILDPQMCIFLAGCGYNFGNTEADALAREREQGLWTRARAKKRRLRRVREVGKVQGERGFEIGQNTRSHDGIAKFRAF